MAATVSGRGFGGEGVLRGNGGGASEWRAGGVSVAPLKYAQSTVCFGFRQPLNRVLLCVIFGEFTSRDARLLAYFCYNMNILNFLKLCRKLI